MPIETTTARKPSADRKVLCQVDGAVISGCELNYRTEAGFNLADDLGVALPCSQKLPSSIRLFRAILYAITMALSFFVSTPAERLTGWHAGEVLLIETALCR
jgi:hypothetical protein